MLVINGRLVVVIVVHTVVMSETTLFHFNI